jgi:hypothetical protein
MGGGKSFAHQHNYCYCEVFFSPYLTWFGCPSTILTDQGTYFINDVIRYLIDHFILRHTNSIVYYPQGNGQAESTNTIFGTLFTKVVNENHND